jgi:hypothetical protein
MVRSLLVISGLMMDCGLAMMFGGVFVVIGGMLMVFVNLVAAHDFSPRLMPHWRSGALPGSMNHLRRFGSGSITPPA